MDLSKPDAIWSRIFSALPKRDRSLSDWLHELFQHHSFIKCFGSTISVQCFCCFWLLIFFLDQALSPRDITVHKICFAPPVRLLYGFRLGAGFLTQCLKVKWTLSSIQLQKRVMFWLLLRTMGKESENNERTIIKSRKIFECNNITRCNIQP